MEKPEVVAEMYRDFTGVTISQLEEKLASAETREEKLFCRAMINLKLQLTQEKIVGEILL